MDYTASACGVRGSGVLQSRSANFCISALFMLAGGLIYLLWRPETIRLFRWLGPATEWKSYSTIRDLGEAARPHDFIIYSLPDGLWLASFGHALLVVVRDLSSASRAIWLAIAAILAIGSEVAQMLGIVGGVFDWNDVLIYIVAGLYLQMVNLLLDLETLR